MIKVNLLPKMMLAGPSDRPEVLYGGILVLVIGLGVTGYLYKSKTNELTDANSRLAGVKERYDRERGEIESADKAKEELRYIEEKEAWILGQTNTQREWGTFLQELKDLTPADTWLTEMKANNTAGTAEFTGRAYTLGAIAHLMVKYDLAGAVSGLRVEKAARSLTLLEENEKERKEAQERQKHTGEKVPVPDELPGLGFAAKIFDPIDFNIKGTFKVQPTATGPKPPPPPGAPPAASASIQLGKGS